MGQGSDVPPQGRWRPPAPRPVVPHPAAGARPVSPPRPDSELSPEERQARDALEQLAALRPDQAEALAVELLEGVASGEVSFAALLGYSDDDIYDIYRKAHVMHAAGRPKAALVLGEGLLALSPGHPAVLMLVVGCHMELKDWPRAFELLEQVLQSDPDDLEALLKRGIVLLRLKRVVEAGLAFQRVLELDPDRESEEAEVAQRLLEALHASFGG